MSDKYVIRTAVDDDLDAVLALRAEAEAWLLEQNIRQWTPDYDDYARGVLTDWVRSGTARVVVHNGQVVATVSLLDTPDPDFWGWADDQDRALYLGKMIVARSHAGRRLGEEIMNWAGRKAAAAHKRWIRIDVRRDNLRLQHYYLARGFEWVRTWHNPARRTESGWLAERHVGVTTQTGIRLVEPPAAGGRRPTTSSSPPARRRTPVGAS